MGASGSAAEPQSDERGLRQLFLNGMSHAASTVNVVTTDGVAGRHGVTVSAMVSVSADTPQPTLLVCIHHLSAAAGALLENGVFCVNVLREDQAHISECFAGRTEARGDAKFDCARWTRQVTGAPRVLDAMVAFDCRVTSSERVGSHFVVLGAVQDIYLAGSGAPLIYANRAYGVPQRIVPHSTVRAGGADADAGHAREARAGGTQCGAAHRGAADADAVHHGGVNAGEARHPRVATRDFGAAYAHAAA